jgi:hypothetical protein
MEKKVYRGQWAGCSNLTEKRKELLKAHKDFLDMLADGYEITAAKPKRQRIKKENFKIVMCFGKPMRLTIEEYNNHWCIAFGK